MPGRAELHAASRRASSRAAAEDGDDGTGADGGRAAGASSPYEDDDYERLPSGAGPRRAAGVEQIRGLAGLVGDAVRRGADEVSRRARRRSR